MTAKIFECGISLNAWKYLFLALVLHLQEHIDLKDRFLVLMHDAWHGWLLEVPNSLEDIPLFNGHSIFHILINAEEMIKCVACLFWRACTKIIMEVIGFNVQPCLLPNFFKVSLHI